MPPKAMPPIEGYSVAAKQRVTIKDPSVHRASNGRLFAKGTCPVTGKGVTVFLSAQQEGGFLSFLTPLISKAGSAAATAAATSVGKKVGERVGTAVGSIGQKPQKGKGKGGFLPTNRSLFYRWLDAAGLMGEGQAAAELLQAVERRLADLLPPSTQILAVWPDGEDEMVVSTRAQGEIRFPLAPIMTRLAPLMRQQGRGPVPSLKDMALEEIAKQPLEDIMRILPSLPPLVQEQLAKEYGIRAAQHLPKPIAGQRLARLREVARMGVHTFPKSPGGLVSLTDFHPEKGAKFTVGARGSDHYVLRDRDKPTRDTVDVHAIQLSSAQERYVNDGWPPLKPTPQGGNGLHMPGQRGQGLFLPGGH